jgi:ribosomal protein S18 acetylase RimI-like enzyme
VADLKLLHRINDYLNSAPRWRCDVVEIGPFDLFLNHGGGNPYMSYARPAREIKADPSDDIRSVSRVFKERGYTPRWEYIDDLNPGLGSALVQAGFAEPEMRPLMVLTSKQRVIAPAGVEFRQVTDDDGLVAVADVQRRGFGIPDESDDNSFDLRQLVEGGMRVWAGFVDGAPVSGGVDIPVGGVAEIAGIATLAEYRRRGIGAALTHTLADDARRQGCSLIFLSAGDEEIARVYRRAGFETVGYAADTMEVDA